MRISIRQQLALLLVFSSVVGLAVLAIATWITNHDFVLNITAARLRTTAVLKAAQIAFNLELMQTAATFLTTRTIIQQSLSRYNSGVNVTRENWMDARDDLEATLGTVGPLTEPLVLQAQVYSRNTSGFAGTSSVLNGTGSGVRVRLPWNNDDGSSSFLGDSGKGYPPALYPNLNITSTSNDTGTTYTAVYEGESLGMASTLILGPLSINDTFSLLSLTLPMVNNTKDDDILGWVTVVTDARLIRLVQQDQRGLGDTGQTLLLGPTNTTNHFRNGIIGNVEAASNAEVRYLLPLDISAEARHPQHVAGTSNPPFPARAYPAVERALVEDNRGIDDVSSILRTHNEADKEVSIGYSVVPSNLVDWTVVVEQARSEVWEPINRLRTIILACLFAVMGFWMIMSFPLAHWAVLPIIRLRAATEQTIDPPQNPNSSSGSSDDSRSCTNGDAKSSYSRSLHGRREGFVETIARWRGKRRGGLHIEQRDDQRFRIPGKVPEKKKIWVKDEMTDLIKTFNIMADELYDQYSKLEDRVRQRTIELEHSKKAAEAANESKTLFVANVSHELRTPLNGILGMCAVCMEESDTSKLKQSLGIIYKSGDLLLRTLTDLLTFSTNQVGHQVLKLDEKEFYLRDLESQIAAIFGEMAKERKINLSVVFEDMPMEKYASPDETRLKDIAIFGDIHRILQIVINLTSNALKFTPADGYVTITLRALAEVPPRRQSVHGKVQFPDEPRDRRAHPGASPDEKGTANFINPREVPQERAPSPPPGHDMFIELEVRDTGEGIVEEYQRTIFEPFVQGDAGLSRKHSGTGLGLSICSQLASLMRGSISLKSKVGSGSTFTAKLPLRRIAGTISARSSLSRKSSRVVSVIDELPSQRVPTMASMTVHHPRSSPYTTTAAAVPSSVGPPPHTSTPSSQARAIGKAGKDIKADKEAQHDFSKVRILVAEDNKVNQEVILRMLKLEKIFDVTIAGDGQEAFDLVKSNTSPTYSTADYMENDSSSSASLSPMRSPYDLIFMDVQMPRMDGISSTRLIREHGYTGPVVALTAYAEQANVDSCYAAGCDYFLSKPIKRPLLRKVLTDYCSPPPSAGKHDVDQVEREQTESAGATTSTEHMPSLILGQAQAGIEMISLGGKQPGYAEDKDAQKD
ncbi:Putative signal transduction response regulator, receiver domain, histidine kinase/HSP90-like ATPase [Septoria linicola]|uniref:histidine kinase n=1 Tax=Septoria linicola TaxID=215465 RepID=A0A9Q9EQY6_9PEZI|nr:putative signal transduction response regulator, receiver domain, histidine kinase/HSP90-like ATPase [Septoria linicola]USW59327.1 Putative signal transduction response regulator, receiver domain, histidine kinase/HSP90-like ATPase [Septoria linicola]